MTNLERAQLLADKAFEILMWNPRGDGKTWEPRSVMDRDRDRAESLMDLSRTYSQLAAAKGDGFWRDGDGE